MTVVDAPSNIAEPAQLAPLPGTAGPSPVATKLERWVAACRTVFAHYELILVASGAIVFVVFTSREMMDLWRNRHEVAELRLTVQKKRRPSTT